MQVTLSPASCRTLFWKYDEAWILLDIHGQLMSSEGNLHHQPFRSFPNQADVEELQKSFGVMSSMQKWMFGATKNGLETGFFAPLRQLLKEKQAQRFC